MQHSFDLGYCMLLSIRLGLRDDFQWRLHDVTEISRSIRAKASGIPKMAAREIQIVGKLLLLFLTA
jgi:hypothetical protein